jgi:hypothetical protein
MNITINNYNDLLKFIKREDVNSKQATEVVCKALNVLCIFEKSKDEVIKATEYYINRFCKNGNSQRPLFLEQKEDQFNIKDIYSM